MSDFKDKIEGDPAFKRMMSGKIWTPGTKTTYGAGVLDFCRYAEKTPTEIIEAFRENGGKEFFSLLNEWMRDLVDRVAPKTLKNFMLSVKRFIQRNVLDDFEVDDEALDKFERSWKRLLKIRRELVRIEPAIPKEFRHSFTHEDLSRVVKKCKDNRERVLLTLLASSGPRIEAALGLELRDIQDLDADQSFYMVKVRKELSKSRKAYYTYMSRECRDFLKDYIEEREQRGDKIGPRSKVLVTETFRGKPRYMDRSIAKFRKLSAQRANPIFRQPFKRLGMLKTMKVPGRSGTAKGIRYNISPHRLRYWFKSTCNKHGVSDNVSEFWMGHGKKNQDMSAYYSEEERDADFVREEYAKVVEEFTFTTPYVPEEFKERLNGYEDETRRLGKIIEDQKEQIRILTLNIKNLVTSMNELLKERGPFHLDFKKPWESRLLTEEEVRQLDEESAPYDKLLKEAKKKPGTA